MRCEGRAPRQFLFRLDDVEPESSVNTSCICCVCVTHSVASDCDPMDCSPPGSSVHGILQARTLEWVAISFSKGSSRPRDQTQVSCIAGGCFTVSVSANHLLNSKWALALTVLAIKDHLG